MTGGWMDAGDMLKFAQNTAFATAALEAAARLDPAHAPDIGADANVGIRWLDKLRPHPNLFVIQVGDHRDHDRAFSDPALDDASSKPGIGHRLAYHWGARRRRRRQGCDGARAGRRPCRRPRRTRLIGEAEDWYAAGRAAHRPTPRVVDPFYVDSNWKDSMAAGAAALYRVTGDASYLHDARRYLRQYGNGDAWGYYEMSPFAAADLCGALGAPPLGGNKGRRQGCSALRASARQIEDEAKRTGFGASGFLSWGTTETDAAGGAEALLAAEFAHFDGGRRIAAGGRDYLLGRNPWGRASSPASARTHRGRSIPGRLCSATGCRTARSSVARRRSRRS